MKISSTRKEAAKRPVSVAVESSEVAMTRKRT